MANKRKSDHQHDDGDENGEFDFGRHDDEDDDARPDRNDDIGEDDSDYYYDDDDNDDDDDDDRNYNYPRDGEGRPLLGLVHNDPEFTNMSIDDCVRVDVRTGEMIGRHDHLKKLIFCGFHSEKSIFDACLRSVAKNRSIEELIFSEVNNCYWGDIFDILAPFLENNLNLRRLTIHSWDHFPNAEIYSLTSILHRCRTSSLQSIEIVRSDLSAESALGLIPALTRLPQLKKLRLNHNRIFGRIFGRSLCEALAELIRNSPKLEELALCDCAMGVEDVEILAGALAGNKSVKNFILFGYEGWGRQFATTIGEKGWGTLVRHLCNTSSINKTYHSNHTLERVYDKWYPPEHVEPLPPDVIQHLLALNAVADKKYVAMKKIILFHDEIDVKPLSEWGLKMLPCIMEWFGNAKALVVEEVNLCIDSIRNLPYSESSCFILNLMASHRLSSPPFLPLLTIK